VFSADQASFFVKSTFAPPPNYVQISHRHVLRDGSTIPRTNPRKRYEAPRYSRLISDLVRLGTGAVDRRCKSQPLIGTCQPSTASSVDGHAKNLPPLCIRWEDVDQSNKRNKAPTKYCYAYVTSLAQSRQRPEDRSW